MSEPPAEPAPPAEVEHSAEEEVAEPTTAVAVEAEPAPQPQPQPELPQQQPAPIAPSTQQKSPLPLLLGAIGTAAFLFLGSKLFGKGKKRQLDPHGAFLEYIELAAAPNPNPPAAPLLLSGLRFAWKDM